MSLKKKILLLFIISIFFQIVVYSDSIRNFLIKTNVANEFGDLYNICRVNYFKHKMPPLKGFEQFTENTIEDSEVFILGDSFLDVYFGHDSFNVLLENYSKKLCYRLKSLNIKEVEKIANSKLFHKKRFLIIECSERNIINEYYSIKPEIKKKKSDLKERIFNPNFEYIFRNLIGLKLLYNTFMSLRFKLFKDISDFLIYSYKEKMLFLKSTYNGKYGIIKDFDKIIYAKIASNIENLAINLKKNYNIEVIFLPVPNKISIYNHYFDKNLKYNGFINRVCEGLDKKGIKNINLYKIFKKSKKLLYYKNDSHWNKTGVKLAVKKVIEKLY